MADELDSNQKFAALSPEAQQIIRRKLNSLSPDAQQIIRQKLTTQQPQPSLLDQATNLYQQYKQSPLYRGSPQGMLETANDLVRKGADVLGEKTAEKMGGAGINPNLAAGVGTAIQMAPDIATSIAAPTQQIEAPGIVKNMGSGLANQLESASGAVPGSLKAAFNDSSLIGAPGKKAASPLYEAAKNELPAMVKKAADLNPLKGLWKPDQIVEAAQAHLAQGGTLEPSEALVARKAVDKLLKAKNVVSDELLPLRGQFDQLAKESKNIATADPIYQRGRMAESLRNLIPQNKYGGASAFKMGIAPALSGLGGFIAGAPGAAIGAGIAGGLLSPAVQGAAATGAGIAARAIGPLANPSVGITVGNVLNHLAQMRKKRNSQ